MSNRSRRTAAVWRLSALATCGALTLSLAACGSSDDGGARAGTAANRCTKDYSMGMLVMAQHTLFANMVAGYKEGFSRQTGIPVSELEIDEQNAQGEPGNYQSLARAFASGSEDLVAVVGTPPTIALSHVIKDKPIVTIAIDDPTRGGLADSAERPGRNVTGSVDPARPDQIAAGILELQPDIRSIGTIFTQGNEVPIAFNEVMEKELEGHGVEYVATSISNPGELQSAARSLLDKVDAIVISRDGAVAAGLPAIAAEAQRRRRPIYLAYSGPDALIPGVAGGYGADEHEVGVLAGEVAGKICAGADAAATAFAVYDDHRWQFRQDTLDELRISVPPALRERSELVEP